MRMAKKVYAAILRLRRAGRAVYRYDHAHSTVDGVIVSTSRLKMMATALPVLLVTVLVGCSAGQVASTVSSVQQACVSVQPALAAGAASGIPQARDIAGYGNAVCGPVMGGGAVPASVDASTPAWLGSLAGMLKVILPLAVGLL